MGIGNTLTHGGKWVYGTLLAFTAAAIASAMLVTKTADLRYERDVNRMVFNDNLGVLDEVKAKLGVTSDSLSMLENQNPIVSANTPYLVVSIEEHRLWYKRGSEVLFEAPVATGSGKSLVSNAGGKQYKFDTPRGRLTVEGKGENPDWVPPDWHFQEQANKRGLGLAHMERGTVIHQSDGSVVKVSGSEIVKQYSDGRQVPLEATDGHEIVVNGNILIPPYGVNQRRYKGILGTRRLELGDGYGIHGTNAPESIGRSVSHGCVRMRNEDIERLYDMVPVGTPVYIY
ncbi:MAG TPA: L,D-transpeptidase [Gemmatimonadaceae bacterium]|nr:L,D-transpeptidase [Gemmatimonadaceae bacterium]